ncbi:MAG: hypothetical protein LBM01_02900 [Christensenellaceae bacterium]|jgi:hypothetical protein|nr:hypothetical protein [Christensenellaceae bacterium]
MKTYKIDDLDDLENEIKFLEKDIESKAATIKIKAEEMLAFYEDIAQYLDPQKLALAETGKDAFGYDIVESQYVFNSAQVNRAMVGNLKNVLSTLDNKSGSELSWAELIKKYEVSCFEKDSNAASKNNPNIYIKILKHELAGGNDLLEDYLRMRTENYEHLYMGYLDKPLKKPEKIESFTELLTRGDENYNNEVNRISDIINEGDLDVITRMAENYLAERLPENWGGIEQRKEVIRLYGDVDELTAAVYERKQLQKQQKKLEQEREQVLKEQQEATEREAAEAAKPLNVFEQKMQEREQALRARREREPEPQPAELEEKPTKPTRTQPEELENESKESAKTPISFLKRQMLRLKPKSTAQRETQQDDGITK